MAIIDLILTTLGLVKFPYYEWPLALITSMSANTIFEAIVGQIIHILFAGMLGVVFAYIILLISSRSHLILGWLYGFFVWFAVHVAVNLFNFQLLKPIPISQMISDFTTASIYGLVLSAALHRLSPKKVSQR